MLCLLKYPGSNTTVPTADQKDGWRPAACPAAMMSWLRAMASIAGATWAASLTSWVRRGSRNTPSPVRGAWAL